MVLCQNIQASALGNFTQSINNGTDVGPYDYGAIMHYGESFFTANGNDTIVTKPVGIPIGLRIELTELELQVARTLYGSQPSATVITITLPDCR